MHCLLRFSPAALLLVTLLLTGCGDESGDPVGNDPIGNQVGNQAGEPIDMPATPEQIEMLNRVLERFPAVRPLADQARADGTVTEQEIIRLFTEAEKAKAARGGE